MADQEYQFIASNLDTDGYLIDFAGWGQIWIKWAFNVLITIYDDPVAQGAKGKVECWFNPGTGPVATVVQSPDQQEGGGFWNAGGLVWGSDDLGIRLYNPGAWDSTDDYEAKATEECNDFTASRGGHFFVSRYSDGIVPMDVHTDVALGSSWSRNLTDNDFDGDGNLKPLTLARLFKRRLEWAGDTHGQTHPDVFIPVDTSVLEDMGPITTEQLGIDWKYYPWAVKKDGDWKSLNREYQSVPVSANRNAYLRIMKNGAWDDVLNDLEHPDQFDPAHPDRPCSESHIMIQNGNWKRAEPYGSGA